MSKRFRVHVSKDYLTFCSGHFITFEGDRCERLHGHNYRTSVDVEGPLDENYYVFDFVRLKKLTKSILDPLDHRMLLPTSNAYVKLEERGAGIRATYRDREWVFPRD